MFFPCEVVREETGIAGRFRQTVSMADGESKTLFEAQGRVLQQRSGAADHTTKAIQAIGGEVFVGIQKKLKQCGDHADTGHLLFVESSPEAAGLELPVQDDASLTIKRSHQSDDDAVDMVDGQDAHQTIGETESMPVGDGIRIDQKIGHRQDDAFRRPGCPGCVNDQGRIVESGGARGKAGSNGVAVFSALSPGLLPVKDATVPQGDHFAQGRQHGLKGVEFLVDILPAEGDRGLRMFEDIPLLLGCFFDIDRHDGDSQGPGCEVGQRRQIMVEQHGGDPVAAGQAELRMKHLRHPFDDRAEFRIAVGSAQVPVVVAIGQEIPGDESRVVQARSEELGERGPVEFRGTSRRLAGLFDPVMDVGQEAHRSSVPALCRGLVV